MSCDWNILCVDCGETTDIIEANHAVELMRALISQAAAIGALVTHPDIWELELRANGYYIPIDFFRKHHTHHLRPVDEYGQFDTPCPATFYCSRCAKQVQCEDREHPRRPNEHVHYINRVGHR